MAACYASCCNRIRRTRAVDVHQGLIEGVARRRGNGRLVAAVGKEGAACSYWRDASQRLGDDRRNHQVVYLQLKHAACHELPAGCLGKRHAARRADGVSQPYRHTGALLRDHCNGARASATPIAAWLGAWLSQNLLLRQRASATLPDEPCRKE